jgi:hypothetical protein
MISLFQSDTNPAVFGFTRDPTGQNLPTDYAPWRKSPGAGSLFLGVGESSAQLGAGDPVIRAMDSNGYYLVGGASRRTRHRRW